MTEYVVSNASAVTLTADNSDNVYVGESGGDIVSYNESGSVRWTATDPVGNGDPVTALHEDGDRLYVGHGNNVYILDSTDGTLIGTTTSVGATTADVDGVWGRGGDEIWLISGDTLLKYIGGTGGWNYTQHEYTHTNRNTFTDLVLAEYGADLYAYLTSVSGAGEVNVYRIADLDAASDFIEADTANIVGNNALSIAYDSGKDRIYIGGDYIENAAFKSEIYAYAATSSLTTNDQAWRYDAGETTVPIDSLSYTSFLERLYAVGENGNINVYEEASNDPDLLETYGDASGNFTQVSKIDGSNVVGMIPNSEIHSVDSASSGGSLTTVLTQVTATQPSSVATMNTTSTKSVESVQAVNTTVLASMNGYTKVSPVAEQFSATSTMNTATAENLYKYATATQVSTTIDTEVGVTEDLNTEWIIYDGDDERHIANTVEFTGQVPEWKRGQEITETFIFSGPDAEATYEKIKSDFGRYLRDETVIVNRDYRGRPHFIQNTAPNASKSSYLFRIDPNPTAELEQFWVVVTNINDATRVAEGKGRSLEITMVPLGPVSEYTRSRIRREFEATV